MRVTACLVVYNEEAVIERCLESISLVVDEIIIIMDGKSTDSTKSICKEFGCRIYEQKHLGEAEPHKMLSYSLAKNDWILEIDADEYLSLPLQDFIKKREFNADAYRFIWRQYYGDKLLRMRNYGKTVLFNKKRMLDETRVLRTDFIFKGETKLLDYEIFHKPVNNIYHPIKSIERRKRKAKIKAIHLVEYGVVKQVKIIYLPKSIISFCYEFLKLAFFKRVILDGIPGINYCISVSQTYFYMNIEIYRLKCMIKN